MIRIKHIVGILCIAGLLLSLGCGSKEDQGEQKETNVQGPTKYGIVAFEQTDDAYAKTNVWKYLWKIELEPDLSRDNTFELFKRTEIISVQGHADIHPQIAKQVLLEASDIEKYKDKQLKFTFRIGDEAPADDFSNFGQSLSGWSYGISIGNIGTSNFMLFPGTGIANIKINKEGGFVGSDLEFISFETEKESVKYKNTVVLRKKADQI
ncbi:hypothetical protein ACFL5Z_07385 [Planctomycetota bacterium]